MGKRLGFCEKKFGAWVHPLTYVPICIYRFSHAWVLDNRSGLRAPVTNEKRGPVSGTPVRISYGKVSCGRKGFSAAFDLCQLAFQVADLYKVAIDPGLDLLHLALLC